METIKTVHLTREYLLARQTNIYGGRPVEEGLDLLGDIKSCIIKIILPRAGFCRRSYYNAMMEPYCIYPGSRPY